METFEMIRMVEAPIDITITDTSVTPAAALNLNGLTVKLTVKRKGDLADNDDAALIAHIITEHANEESGQTGFIPTESERAIPAGLYKADVRVFNAQGVDLITDTMNFRVLEPTSKEK
jgi:hypothetical protein